MNSNLNIYSVNAWPWFRPHVMNKSFFFLDLHVPLLDKYFLRGQDTWCYLPQTNTSCTLWIVFWDLYAHSNSNHINNQAWKYCLSCELQNETTLDCSGKLPKLLTHYLCEKKSEYCCHKWDLYKLYRKDYVKRITKSGRSY